MSEVSDCQSDQFTSESETSEILADPDAMSAITEGLTEIETRNVVALEEARQRFEELKEQARRRAANMSDYPDSPEYAAELAATTEAMMPLQLRAQAWQADEEIAEAELARGEERQFDNAEDAIRWLTDYTDLPASMLQPVSFDDSSDDEANLRHVKFEPVNESEDQ